VSPKATMVTLRQPDFCDGDVASESESCAGYTSPIFALTDERDNFVRTEAITGIHCAPAPFFSSAGQLDITVSGCAAPFSGVARTRNR
jgi:hypothetical protein